MTRGRGFILGMGCSGWSRCLSCGGTCSQDDGDERPVKPSPFPQVPVRPAWRLDDPEWRENYDSYRREFERADWSDPAVRERYGQWCRERGFWPSNNEREERAWQLSRK